MIATRGWGAGPVSALARRLMSTGSHSGQWSKVAAALLVALDGLEQRLEVALAEALRAPPLDDLEEHRRAVGDGLGEDLQQVPVEVLVGQDVQALQLLPRQVEAGQPLPGLLVVGLG